MDIQEVGARIFAPRKKDFAAWRELFRGYARFYKCRLTDEQADIVWQWLQSPAHELCGLVAEHNGALAGLAHYRPFVRPLTAARGMYLDDLFVREQSRRRGIGGALMARVAKIARAENRELVRWITAPDNRRARKMYDKTAQGTERVIYDMKL